MVNNPGKWLNVRSGPGTSYSVLFRLEKGDAVDVLAEDDGGDKEEDEEIRQSVIDELMEIRKKLDHVIRRMGGAL